MTMSLTHAEYMEASMDVYEQEQFEHDNHLSDLVMQKYQAAAGYANGM